MGKGGNSASSANAPTSAQTPETKPAPMPSSMGKGGASRPSSGKGGASSQGLPMKKQPDNLRSREFRKVRRINQRGNTKPQDESVVSTPTFRRSRR